MTDPLVIPALGVTCCDPAPDPLPPVAEPIEHDGWFPGIDLTRLRAEGRIRDTVTAARLLDAALSAMIWVGDQLAGWQGQQIEAGYASLAAVPAPAIMGESRKVILYRQAVTGWAKALVVERYRDTDTTGAGDRRVDEIEMTPGELRRDAIHAVRAMLGQTRTAVELI